MKKHRIYVVDDDDDDLEHVNEVIKTLGCGEEVLLLHSVKELMTVLNRSIAMLPDLIILDHQLPGTGGDEAIRQLRSDSRYDKTALAVYSSHLMPHKENELKQSGVDACFSKGVSMEEITGHVRSFCEAVERRRG